MMQKQGSVIITELAKVFDVSGITIQHDFKENLANNTDINSSDAHKNTILWNCVDA